MTVPPDSLAVIVVAAGSARRFGRDKLFVSLGGRAVLGWSLRAFQDSEIVSSIVLVLNDSRLADGRRLAETEGISKLQAICSGGTRRQDSVRNGLHLAAGAYWVAVHDGARPFVTPEIVARGMQVARQAGAAIAAVPVKDTIKVVRSEGMIEETPPRSLLWSAQTPQIFQYQQLCSAFEANGDADVTDDAELLERAGLPTAVFRGSYDNLKITTPEDLALARVIARSRQVSPPSAG